MKKWTQMLGTTALVATLAAGVPSIAFAQEVEEVLVTGSRIKRASTFDIPAPVEVVSRAEIDKMGVPTIIDMVKNLTINTGSNFNNDFSTQRQTVGTSQVDLRGIGLNSTLTLVNGRRITLTSTSNDQGDTFVDINQFPLLMIERIEVLKDGAAAIYGSDAVAGVFNMITRSGWEGFEIDGGYQTTTEDSQTDYTLSAAFGAGNETYHVNFYYTYFKRTDLNGIERDFFPAFPESSTNTSGFGHVPTLIFSRGTPTTGPFAGTGITGFALDPDCGVQNSIPAPFAGGIAGFCRTDFSPSFGLIARETRHTAFGEATAKISDNITFFGETSFARNRATDFQASPPPVINEAILILADHPANPHGVDLVYFGRVAETQRSPRPATNDYFRVLGGVEIKIGDSWSAETAYTYSTHDFSISNEDTLLDRLTVPSGDAEIPRAIRNDFNPFGSRFTAAGPFNDPAVLEDIIGVVRTDATSSLSTADISFSGDAFEAPGGTVGFAFGGQWRQDMLRIDLDANINRNLLGFEGGSADTPRVTRDVTAVYAEASVPIIKNLELQLALRFEDYEGAVGNTTDPKIALLWQPTDILTVRGSWGTSFRAPSLYQTNVGGQTIRPVAFDPFNNNPASACDTSAAGIIFPSSVAVGNPNLKPEDASNFNAGAVVRPAKGFSISLDYWRFDIDDIIIKDSLQQILNNDCLDDGIANDPRVNRGPGGVIRSVDVAFDNAASLITSGLDFAASYNYDAGDLGTIDAGVRATYITKYSFRQVAGEPRVDGAGSRNFTNPFTSAPEWRVNVNLNWTRGSHSAGAIVRYISSYKDDNGGGAKINSHTTLDLQYSIRLDQLFGTSKGTMLSTGVLNVFDNDPPFAVGVQGFDSKVHDPRGRMIYIRARQNF